MEEHGGKRCQSSSVEMILQGIGGRGELGLYTINRRRCDSTERWRVLLGSQQLGGRIASGGCIE